MSHVCHQVCRIGLLLEFLLYMQLMLMLVMTLSHWFLSARQALFLTRMSSVFICVCIPACFGSTTSIGLCTLYYICTVYSTYVNAIYLLHMPSMIPRFPSIPILLKCITSTKVNVVY